MLSLIMSSYWLFISFWNQERIFFIFILNQAVKTYKIIDFIGSKNTNKIKLMVSITIIFDDFFISRLDIPLPTIFTIITKK